MTITNELLQKSLKALQEVSLTKSLKIKKSGKEIKEGIARKIGECQAKIAVFKAIPAKANSDNSLHSEHSSHSSHVDDSNKWRIESLERKIKDYETISRNLKDNLTYELDRYELTDYGL